MASVVLACMVAHMRDAVERYEAAKARVVWLQDYLMNAKTAFDEQVRPIKEHHAMRRKNPVRWSELLLDEWAKFLASVRLEAFDLIEAEAELLTAKAALRVKEPEGVAA